MPIEPVRFEERGERIVVGVREVHQFATAGQTMGAQWGKLKAHGEIAGAKPMQALGVMCATDMAKGTIDYLCGCEVAELTADHGGMDRVNLVPARYAVFWHGGHVSEARPTWEAIYGEWLPHSEYKPHECPELEVYDERFNGETLEGGFEIWIPVEPKA